MMLDVHYMISLGLIFVMFATGAWKRSYSTMIMLLAITYSMYTSRLCDFSMGQFVVNITCMVLVFRAIVTSENDRLIK